MHVKLLLCTSSVPFSLSVVSYSATPWTAAHQWWTGFPVHHQLPELTETHIHWVSDAIQPSNPLSSPSPPAFNLSQHQGLFNESVICITWPKYWSFSFSFQWIFRTDFLSFPSFLGWTGWISLQSKGLLRVFSKTTVQKHQFFSTQLYL